MEIVNNQIANLDKKNIFILQKQRGNFSKKNMSLRQNEG
jgi:hypothetical protein